jgi:hypothetical protein
MVVVDFGVEKHLVIVFLLDYLCCLAPLTSSLRAIHVEGRPL